MREIIKEDVVFMDSDLTTTSSSMGADDTFSKLFEDSLNKDFSEGDIVPGRVIHVGKQIGTAEGKLVDADGKLYAHATTTCLIFNV